MEMTTISCRTGQGIAPKRRIGDKRFDHHGRPWLILMLVRNRRPSWAALLFCLSMFEFAIGQSTTPKIVNARKTDYYVSTHGKDRNDGSRTHPWATISHAATQVGPGSTVHVQPGSYAETSVGKNSELQDLLTTASGTPTARVRYISDELWMAKIVGSGRPRTAVWKNTGDYVDIVGFEIVGGAGTADGILLTGASDYVMGNKVHDIPVPGNNVPNGGSGITSTIKYTTAIGNKAIGNIVYNIGAYPIGVSSLVHGIYWGTPLGVIQNNIVYKVQGFCIELNHNPNESVIVNNTVFNCGTVANDRRHGGGIDIGSQDFSPVDYITVNNNIIVDCPGRYAIQEMYTGSGSVGPHNVFRNNLIFRNAANFNIRYSQSPTGTIVKDPQFANYKLDGTGDYRPQNSSPAVGGGTTACASTLPNCTPRQDFRGATRTPRTASGKTPERDEQHREHRINSTVAETPAEHPSIGAYEPSQDTVPWPWY